MPTQGQILTLIPTGQITQLWNTLLTVHGPDDGAYFRVEVASK